MRFVVIFKAKVKDLDDHYLQTAQTLRARALAQFNCQKFESIAENGFEIALSYWNSLDDIQAWHKDAEHQTAQKYGRKHWYQHFSVDVCEIRRSYGSLN